MAAETAEVRPGIVGVVDRTDQVPAQSVDGLETTGELRAECVFVVRGTFRACAVGSEVHLTPMDAMNWTIGSESSG